MKKCCFAICDDEYEVRHLLQSWLADSSYNADVKEYSSGEELLRDMDQGTQIDAFPGYCHGKC